jgi:hypothetical protein
MGALPARSRHRLGASEILTTLSSTTWRSSPWSTSSSPLARPARLGSHGTARSPDAALNPACPAPPPPGLPLAWPGLGPHLVLSAPPSATGCGPWAWPRAPRATRAWTWPAHLLVLALAGAWPAWPGALRGHRLTTSPEGVAGPGYDGIVAACLARLKPAAVPLSPWSWARSPWAARACSPPWAARVHQPGAHRHPLLRTPGATASPRAAASAAAGAAGRGGRTPAEWARPGPIVVKSSAGWPSRVGEVVTERSGGSTWAWRA